MNDSKTSNDSGKSKHKKKVSFSIFEISTFDELAKLRKMREEELDDFVLNKKNTNQYLTNLNQRNKILSMSNYDLISNDNNDKNTNYNNNIIRYNKNKIINNNIINIPKPIKKEETSGYDSYFNNPENMAEILNNKITLNKKKKKVVFSSDEDEDIKSNDIFTSPPQYNSLDKNEIIKDIDNIHSPINKTKDILNKDNIFSPNSNDINNYYIDTQKNNILLSENTENKNIYENNDINNNIENNIKNNEYDTATFNKIDNNNNNINDKIIIKVDNNKNEENNIENENENENEKEDNNSEEPEENNNNILKDNIIVLFNLLEKKFQISPIYKLNLIQEFFNNLFNFIEYKYDEYIDYEKNDNQYYEEVQGKSKLIHQKLYFYSFINNVQKRIAKKKLYNEHKIKAKKYAQYINYKYKIYAFNNLLTFSIKQKEWIKMIQAGLMKKLVWNCMDSLKLYANYRKIKNYLRIRKKKKIFDALKNNKQLSIQLLKNGRKLSLIFEYRHFFNNCRKKILAEKGKEINDKLVNEFRNQYLLRGIFNLIKKNHDIRKEKKNKIYNNKMIQKNNNIKKDFINIKVTRKETVKYNNGSSLMRIQNKINVIK